MTSNVIKLYVGRKGIWQDPYRNIYIHTRTVIKGRGGEVLMFRKKSGINYKSVTIDLFRTELCVVINELRSAGRDMVTSYSRTSWWF